MRETLEAAKALRCRFVSYPNSDARRSAIIETIEQYRSQPNFSRLPKHSDAPFIIFWGAAVLLETPAWVWLEAPFSTYRWSTWRRDRRRGTTSRTFSVACDKEQIVDKVKLHSRSEAIRAGLLTVLIPTETDIRGACCQSAGDNAR